MKWIDEVESGISPDGSVLFYDSFYLCTGCYDVVRIPNEIIDRLNNCPKCGA